MRFLWLKFIPAAALLIALTAGQPSHADERIFVELPVPMQEHMLSNMRGHLRALEEIFDYLAAGDADSAGAIAEKQLGLGSLKDHGAAHLAGYMPQPMQYFGTEMHKAASRFTQAAQDADVQQTFQAQQKVFAALQDITAQCNACHKNYRIR